MIVKFIKEVIKKLFQDYFEKKIILEAKQLSIKNSKKKIIKNLSDVEFQVYSQWGEDGIIDWLVKKIPQIPNIFVEIGTQDYTESNTRFLLINKNWDGYLLEANKQDVKKIKKQRIYWKYNLKVQNAFIDKKNVNFLIKKMRIPKKIGILSLDIDSTDYWILRELSVLDPSIIICEYNSLFGLKKSVTVPYKKNFIRSKEHYSNLYFGASINAFSDILKKKGYFLLGTNSAGNNAFFVKKIHWNKLKKIVLNKKIFRSKFRESRNKKGNLTYLNKKDALKIIANKSLIDLKNRSQKKIIDLKLLD